MIFFSPYLFWHISDSTLKLVKFKSTYHVHSASSTANHYSHSYRVSYLLTSLTGDTHFHFDKFIVVWKNKTPKGNVPNIWDHNHYNSPKTYCAVKYMTGKQVGKHSIIYEQTEFLRTSKFFCALIQQTIRSAKALVFSGG